MTDNNDKDRKSDGSRPAGGTLTLKRPSIEQSKVKQSFGAGRSKTVVVETKRKRFGDDKPATPLEPKVAPRVAAVTPSPPSNTQTPAAPKPHIGQLLPPHAGRPGRMCGFKPPARAKQTHDALGPLSPAGAFGRLRRPSSAPTHPPSTTALLGHPGRCACRLKGLLVGGSRRPSSSMIAVLLKPLRLPSQEHSLASVAMLFPARPMFSAHRPLVDEGVKGRLAWPACWPNVVTPSCHRRHCCWLAGAAQRRAACRSARTGCL